MSKNSPKQLVIQLEEWLKSRGIKKANTTGKKSRFNSYKEKGRR